MGKSFEWFGLLLVLAVKIDIAVRMVVLEAFLAEKYWLFLLGAAGAANPGSASWTFDFSILGQAQYAILSDA